MARRVLSLAGYQGEMVLMPSAADDKVTLEAIRVTVFGPNFPQRAVAPELLVGRSPAQGVHVAPDQQSIRGYFFEMPRSGARIRVRYGDSQEGIVRNPFRRQDVRPLPKGCRD